MSQELAKLSFRLQKAFTPTVHVLVPKILFTSTVAQIVKERGDEAAACRELFRLGVWTGSLAATHLASLASLKRLWPGKIDPRGVASYVEIIGSALWHIFVGHQPRARAAVLENGGLVWVEVEEAPGEDAFYKVLAPTGVDPLFFVAGMFEGAFETSLSIVEARGEWMSMWRPFNGRGVCGFLAHRNLTPDEAAKDVEAKQRDFFRVISWNHSVTSSRELLGEEAP